MTTHIHTARCPGMHWCLTTGFPQPPAASGDHYILTHLISGKGLHTSEHHDLIDILIDGGWPTPFISARTFLQLRSCWGGAVTLIQWSSQNESAHARWIKNVRAALQAPICIALECLWYHNEVIAGLRVFGGPPGWAPSPYFWHVERLNYRQQTHKLFTQPSSLHQHC